MRNRRLWRFLHFHPPRAAQILSLQSGHYFREADLIGIGAAVACRPLPHHRAYGSVHGGSRSYALTRRRMREGQAIGSRHWKALQTRLWLVRDTRDQDHCRRCYSPFAAALLVPTVPPCDDVEFSIVAKEQHEVADEPSGLNQSALRAFRRSRSNLASPADTEPTRPLLLPGSRSWPDT